LISRELKVTVEPGVACPLRMRLSFEAALAASGDEGTVLAVPATKTSSGKKAFATLP